MGFGLVKHTASILHRCCRPPLFSDFRQFSPTFSHYRHFGGFRDLRKRYQLKKPMNFGVIVSRDNTAFKIERNGIFLKYIKSGAHFQIPWVDRVVGAVSLNVEALKIPKASAMTKDGIRMTVQGHLGIKVVDIDTIFVHTDPIYHLVMFAQTTMCLEVSKMTQHDITADRSLLTERILHHVRVLADSYGIACIFWDLNEPVTKNQVIVALENVMVAALSRVSRSLR